MVDAVDSKSTSSNRVLVRVRPPAIFRALSLNESVLFHFNDSVKVIEYFKSFNFLLAYAVRSQSRVNR